MKQIKWSSLLLVSVVGCSQLAPHGRLPSSLGAPQFFVETGVNGDPIVKSKPGDPDYIDPSLREEVSEDVLIRMQNELQTLSSITLEDIEPAQIALPDYDIATKTMRSLMKSSVINYFQSLDSIKREVTRTLSELLALKRLADKETDPKGLLHSEYDIDVKKKIPVLDKTINRLYHKALKNLYSLDSKAVLPSSSFSGYSAKDPFKQQQQIKFAEGLYGICKTSLCLKRLATDLEEWHTFVRKFNNPVSFTEFGSGQKLWTKDGVNTSPIITLAIIDASRYMLQMGLKKNKDYSVAGVLAKARNDVLKTPAGVVGLVVAAPFYLFEKSGKVIADLLSFHVMKVKLGLTDLETYKQEIVFKGLRQNVMDYAKGLNSAIYVVEGEDNSDKIKDAFKSALAKGVAFAPNLMDFFSAKELVEFDRNKIMNLDESMRYVSLEKLAEIKPLLTEDQKKILTIAAYGKNPASLMTKSIPEIVAVLTKTKDPELFVKELLGHSEVWSKVQAAAPDLKIKFEYHAKLSLGNGVVTEPHYLVLKDCKGGYVGKDSRVQILSRIQTYMSVQGALVKVLHNTYTDSIRAPEGCTGVLANLYVVDK